MFMIGYVLILLARIILLKVGIMCLQIALRSLIPRSPSWLTRSDASNLSLKSKLRKFAQATNRSRRGRHFERSTKDSNVWSMITPMWIWENIWKALLRILLCQKNRFLSVLVFSVKFLPFLNEGLASLLQTSPITTWLLIRSLSLPSLPLGN